MCVRPLGSDVASLRAFRLTWAGCSRVRRGRVAVNHLEVGVGASGSTGERSPFDGLLPVGSHLLAGGASHPQTLARQAPRLRGSDYIGIALAILVGRVYHVKCWHHVVAWCRPVISSVRLRPPGPLGGVLSFWGRVLVLQPERTTNHEDSRAGQYRIDSC